MGGVGVTVGRMSSSKDYHQCMNYTHFIHVFSSCKFSDWKVYINGS